MTQMYAIIAGGGSYDDAWSDVRFVTDDQVKGQAFVDKMNALQTEIQSAEDLVQEFMNQYRIKNPQPTWPDVRDQLEVAPRWPSNIKITHEMRAERKRIEDRNQLILEESRKPYWDWHTACQQAVKDFKEATFSIEIQEGMEHDSDTWWNIQPVETLP
jgi:hypothetical protein